MGIIKVLIIMIMMQKFASAASDSCKFSLPQLDVSCRAAAALICTLQIASSHLLRMVVPHLTHCPSRKAVFKWLIDP